MSEHATAGAVRHAVSVDAPPERAFAVFAERMGDWWPRGHTLTPGVEREDVVVEPRAGGRWYERNAAGAECDWGRVLAWEAPRRMLLAWHLDAEWEFDPEPARASEVEVTFSARGGGTRVELEHRGFERHGERGGEIAEGVGSDGGWPEVLAAYAELAAA
jgi:uncharacterized protein YndB with AHSA1/START domain